MANPSSIGVELDVDPHELEPETEPLLELEPDAPLRMLVMGNFSGQSTKKLVRIDRDNLETVLAEFSPKVELNDTELLFRSLSDFEPESLFRKSELFAALRNQTGQPLYAEPDESGAAPLKPTPEQMARLTSPGGLLDAIVEKSAASAEQKPAKTDEFEAMVERIVAPYATPAESAESRQAATERAQRISLLMRHVLHDERFQAFEAGWRGLDLLVHGLDTDTKIHLYLLDISRERLGEFYGLVAGEWGLLIANFAFDRDRLEDVGLLEQLTGLAERLGTPLIAEWLTSQNEDPKAQAAWEKLRRSLKARYLALALPRFLLRLPYGKETIPVEGFEFEEMPGEPAHGEYLWGNPAMACGLVLGRLFEKQGALTPTPGFLRLSDLPMHIVKNEARPCTEVLLSEQDCLNLLDEGLLPLAGVKGADAIVFPRMQSIADPGSLLARLRAASWAD